MTRGPGLRVAGVLAAGLAILSGCNDDDDGGGTAHPFGSGTRLGAAPAPMTDVVFFDDFSGGFPQPNWGIRSGSPFVSSKVGNSHPGLALLPEGGRSRVRSEFEFSLSSPTTVSFDLAVVYVESNSRFKFKILPAEEDAGSAAFEVQMDDDEYSAKIEGAKNDTPFVPFSGYKSVEFIVDSGRTATWRMDGQILGSRADFPPGDCRIEIEATGRHTTKFVVDNVKITRP